MQSGSPPPRHSQRGFTLLEVIIALTIVGVAFAGLMAAMMQSTGNVTHTRDRVLSHWVASNVLTELQVMQEWDTGTLEGEMRMGEIDWYWEATIQNTQNPRLRRVDVSVYFEEGDDYASSTLMGLLQDPESSRSIPQPPPGNLQPPPEQQQ
ncbi:MAG: type II secretion system minor pseudopilin GspI [Ectothiorhodospiraceae bacterium]|nr:type II secretion system minor pseudopilin GspI [Ectothiorhodospiraceae bacterium]MCH8503060.1 type II secretion system minor pseudopilin GspI [Ectothiorhodospiraceae bacterium]